MSRLCHVLAIDDEPDVLRALLRLLPAREFQVDTVDDPRVGLSRLLDEPVDVALLDVLMPQMTGLEVLHRLRQQQADTQVILITGHSDVETAVAAMKEGACDFLTKPFDRAQVVRAVRRAAERRLAAERSGNPTGPRPATGLLGSSPAITEVLRLIETVAPAHISVLIQGESGTGKDLVARAIHARSSRWQSPFVTVSCSTLSETVVESELFGHARGAFTGAVAERRGLIAAASGGTLYLDEVADLSPAMQIKLLRALQDGEIRPVGQSRPVRVDVRLLASSHVNLHKAVEHGSFRPDLYYRLAVITLQLPPLRERLEDVPLLAGQFLRLFARQIGRDVCGIDEEAMRHLCQYDWPGNVRELENVIQRAAVLGQGRAITAADLPWGGPDNGPAVLPAQQFLLGYRREREAALLDFERRYAAQLLRLTLGNVCASARLAGLDPGTFRRILRRCGVQAEAFRA